MINIKVISSIDILSGTISATFDELGGTIGRAENSTLVLPDPEKHISRLHASIDYRHGHYHICNHGSATPVFLNGQPLEKEQSETIKSGDEIRIGGYVMQVLADEQSVESLLNSSDRISPDNQNPDMDFFAEPAEASFDRKQHSSEKSRESDLKGNHLDSPDPFADPFEKNKSQELSGLIPESYDPFADLPASDGMSGDLLSGKKSDDLLNDQALQRSEQGIDDYIKTKTPLDDLSKQQPDMSNIDPLLVLEGAAKKNGQSKFHVQRDDVPELHGSFEPPIGGQFDDEVKKAQQPVCVSSGQQFPPGDSSLLDAFLAGAGMQGRNLQTELTPEFFVSGWVDIEDVNTGNVGFVVGAFNDQTGNKSEYDIDCTERE